MADELGWDDARVDLELGAYRERSEAEDAAALTVDDEAAQQARGRTGDVLAELAGAQVTALV